MLDRKCVKRGISMLEKIIKFSAEILSGLSRINHGKASRECLENYDCSYF